MEAVTIAKRIQGLLDNKYLHWIENKGGHIEKNLRPRPKCQHHVFDRIFYVVMDDKLRGATKSLSMDYFFMKELVGKIDQLSEAFSSGKAQIFKNTSSWWDGMKFRYHLTHFFRRFIEKQNSKFCDFQQIFNICNARWNFSAILASFAHANA